MKKAVADHHDGGEIEVPSRKPWFCVNTHAHREAIAKSHLQRQEFEVYLPQFLRRVSHARRVKMVVRPLFPGYLFVRQHSLSGPLSAIMSTVGVRSVVRSGTDFGLLAHEFIEGLRAHEDGGLIALPRHAFVVGEKVRVAHGPFEGVVAEILGMNDKDRVLILVNLLQRSVRVQTSLDFIEKAG